MPYPPQRELGDIETVMEVLRESKDFDAAAKKRMMKQLEDMETTLISQVHGGMEDRSTDWAIDGTGGADNYDGEDDYYDGGEEDESRDMDPNSFLITSNLQLRNNHIARKERELAVDRFLLTNLARARLSNDETSVKLLDAGVVGHLIPPGSVYEFVREHRRRLFLDEMFEELVPARRGRP